MYSVIVTPSDCDFHVEQFCSLVVPAEASKLGNASGFRGENASPDAHSTITAPWELRLDGNVLRRDLPVEPFFPAYPSLCYQRVSRELCIGRKLVLRLSTRASNLCRILWAFQEGGWPRWIMDPLHRDDDLDEVKRLHDAVRGLNVRQQPHLIRFSCDGAQRAVHWDFCPAEATEPVRLRVNSRSVS